MSGFNTGKADFFVSYTSTDSETAEWIAWHLEEAGYTVVIQKWDFVPGASFVEEMQRGLQRADKMIAVISDAYFKSGFAKSEWGAAFAKDPDGMNRTLIPVRIENFDVSGLAKPFIYIDLVGCDEEAAKERLLNGVQGKRLKPQTAPKFPGTPRSAANEPQIVRTPSDQPRSAAKTGTDDVYIPLVKKKWTERDSL